MTSGRRQKLLIVSLFLALLVLWDTTLGPDAPYFGLRPTRPDPPKLLPSVRKPGYMRVLFIGNSFTRYWGGQVLIGTRLAMSSPNWRDRPPIYEQSTGNGATLADHWKRGLALARIREGNWDYVVLQDHSEGPLADRAAFYKYARLFDAEIKKAGAKTLLFMTWAKLNKPQEQPGIASAYNALGRELGAEVVPVGVAFRDALVERPGLKMYDADLKHPSPAGSYLTACCFYSFLYGRPPTRLDRVIHDEGGKQWLTVGEADALFLQDLAYRTVTANKLPTTTQPTTQPATQP